MTGAEMEILTYDYETVCALCGGSIPVGVKAVFTHAGFPNAHPTAADSLVAHTDCAAPPLAERRQEVALERIAVALERIVALLETRPTAAVPEATLGHEWYRGVCLHCNGEAHEIGAGEACPARTGQPLDNR